MLSSQPGILAEIPAQGIYLTFRSLPGATPEGLRKRLSELVLDESLVVGLGPSLVARLGTSVAGLHPLEAHSRAGATVPSTPACLWLWLRGEDPGVLLGQQRALVGQLADSFALEDATASFRFREGRDLTGYVDGTENPQGEEALEAGFAQGQGSGLDGGSFVAVQRWVHDLDRFQGMAPQARDHVIGRQISDNDEIDEAPETAHVKRTAQESYDPPAFLVRRSMPWSDPRGLGLVFVAFGRDLDAFERQLRRMVGAEDGVVDALFSISRPVTSASYWCPPVAGNRLDLRVLGA